MILHAIFRVNLFHVLNFFSIDSNWAFVSDVINNHLLSLQVNTTDTFIPAESATTCWFQIKNQVQRKNFIKKKNTSVNTWDNFFYFFHLCMCLGTSHLCVAKTLRRGCVDFTYIFFFFSIKPFFVFF